MGRDRPDSTYNAKEDDVGTNYYYIDGRHIAKTSSLGYGRYRVIWAIEPDELEPNPIRDEYGRCVSVIDFSVMVANADEQDTSNIGEEFS